MLRTLLISTTIAGVMAFGIPTGASAQQSDGKKADNKIHKAGSESNETVTDTGSAINHSAKAVAHKVSGGKRARATCADGKIHHGKTRAAACAEHGGIRS